LRVYFFNLIFYKNKKLSPSSCLFVKDEKLGGNSEGKESRAKRLLI